MHTTSAFEKEFGAKTSLLHGPNSIYASYAVSSDARGKHIGEKLVLDSIEKAKRLDFLILQFNAVVEDNLPARQYTKS